MSVVNTDFSRWLTWRHWHLHVDPHGHPHALRVDGTGVASVTASARLNVGWNIYDERTGRAVAGDFNSLDVGVVALELAEGEGWYSTRWRDPVPAPHPRPGWRHDVRFGRDSWEMTGPHGRLAAEVRLIPPDRAQRRGIRPEDEQVRLKWIDGARRYVEGYFGIDPLKKGERLASEETRPLFAVWARSGFLCRVSDDPVPWRAAVNWDEILLFDDAEKAMLAAERELQKDNQGVFPVFTNTPAAHNCSAGVK